MLRRFVIISLSMAVVLGLVYAALFALFLNDLSRADPYPPFMASLASNSPRAFAEFVGHAFPIGMDAKQAVTLIASQGFHVERSGEGRSELLWDRHAGPCSERYAIMIRQNEMGAIVEAAGNLYRSCL